MKIALNIEAIGARRGGAEKYAGTVARWLVAAGHEVHVYARAVDDGELPPQTPIHLVQPFCPPGFGWLRAFLFARHSEREIRKTPFDLIIGFVKVWYQHVYLAVGGAHPAALACNSQRFRSPLLRAAWWAVKCVSPKQWLFHEIARRQFAGPHQPLVIAPARLVAQHFRQYHNLSADRVSVVYNALDTLAAPADPQATRAMFRSQHGLGDEDVAVLFVARNYVLKGLQPLLDSFAPVARNFKNAHLLVCGSDRDRKFRRQARRLGISGQVRFLGFVDDIRGCFAGSDVFAFPTFYDPCSLVLLEAMNAGLPVITTRQNGAGELLSEGEDGFVVDSPWAQGQLTDRLMRLVADPALCRRMGGKAREHVQEFTIDAREKEFLQVLDRAAASRLAQPSLRDAA